MALNGWTTLNAADWHMLPGSGRTLHSVGNGNTDELIFAGPWAQRFSFAQAKTAHLHPSLPGCYCGDIEIHPRDPDMPPTSVVSNILTDLPVYVKGTDPWAIVICRYSTDFSVATWPCDISKPTIESATQLRIEYRSSGQFLYMRSEEMRHEDNPTGAVGGQQWLSDSQAGRKLLQTGEYQLTWLYCQEPPINTWRETMQGRVNSTTFLSCPAETLLFEGFDLKPSTRFDLSDPACWEVTAMLRERRIPIADTFYGWNHEYGPGDNGMKWYRVKMENDAGTVVDRYEKVDFSGMFLYSSCSSSGS